MPSDAQLGSIGPRPRGFRKVTTDFDGKGPFNVAIYEPVLFVRGFFLFILSGFVIAHSYAQRVDPLR
jgi:hypothetical protein